MIASCVELGRECTGIPEITGVFYDLETLRITVRFAEREGPACVTFRGPSGFRVLDEGDLGEFWNPETRPDGWLWRVSAEGWLDLERTRSAFLTGLGGDCKEFLVVGVNHCVSVLAPTGPAVDFS